MSDRLTFHEDHCDHRRAVEAECNCTPTVYVRQSDVVVRLRESCEAVANKAVEYMDEARQAIRELDDPAAAASLLDAGIARVYALLDGAA